MPVFRLDTEQNESAIPGVLMGVFLDDKKSGRIFSAQDYAGLNLEAAIDKCMK